MIRWVISRRGDSSRKLACNYYFSNRHEACLLHFCDVDQRRINVNSLKTTYITTTAEDHHIAKLTALAIGLHVLEAVFPSPLPGVKPGIANIVTLYVLYEYGFATAAWVSLLRVFASSLLLGHFLSPTFVLSLSGAIFSLIALYFAQHLPKRYFSVITLSIIAAFAHIAGQLIVVRLWLWLAATSQQVSKNA